MSRLRNLLHVAPPSTRNTQQPALHVADGHATRNATRNTDALWESFSLVLSTFWTPADEVELAWKTALADIDAAEVTFHATAALIRAGWKPLQEQARTFQARIGLEA
jgi:hypothetical protein